MKKHGLLIFSAIMICVLLVSLVACNGGSDNDMPKVTFKAGMTLDEIKTEFEKVVTCKYIGNVGDAVYTWTLGREGYYVVKTEGESVEYVEAHEYVADKLYVLFGDEENKSQVYDTSGFDVDKNIGLKSMLGEIFDKMTEDGVTYWIENNSIFIKSGENDVLTLKDFNKEKFSLPAEFAKHRESAVGKDVLLFEENDDVEGGAYTFSDTDYHITFNSLVIPSEYKGKPVTQIYCRPMCNLTIPTSVKSIRGVVSTSFGKLTLTYLGTREEWNKVENHDFWDEYSLYTVICSDDTSK